MSSVITPSVSVSEIWKRYGPVDVLKNVSIDFLPGQIHAIVGGNGAGKSTLMKIISGETRPSSGAVWVQGIERQFRYPAEALASGIGCVYQDLSLLDNLSPAQNLFLGSEQVSKKFLIDRKRILTKAREVLGELGLVDVLRKKMPECSVAEQALLEVAKWRSQSHLLLMLDEPTSALAAEECAKLFKLLRSLREQGLAIAYITHRLDEIGLLADVTTVLRDGKVVGRLTQDEISEELLIRLMVDTEANGIEKVIT